MSDDYSADIHTDGSVAVDGSAATGEVETARDFDWFAVELVAGRTYVIDVEGDDTGAGTLGNTVLRGLYDAHGDLIADTRDKDGGIGKNAQLTFTATETETHYIEARGKRFQTGTYTVEVTDETPDLGDITGLTAAQSESLRLDGTADAVTYRRFTLSAEKEVELELLGLDADADLVLEDIGGNELHASRESGTTGETLTATLAAGTYYVRVEAREPGANAFTLHYGLSTYGTNQAPVFAEQSYAFDLAENADGALFGIELGPVEANDTNNDPITYSIVGGDPDGLFFIEAGTGFLLYVGDGENYESGTTHYELTVRASDGSLHSDVTVTVNVTDESELTHVEPPVPAQQQQTTTQQELTYSEPPVPAQQQQTTTQQELTYVEPPPVPAQQQQAVTSVSEPEPASGSNFDNSRRDDFPANDRTSGVVAVGGDSVKGYNHANAGHDHDWFAVALTADVEYRISVTSNDVPQLFGIYDHDEDIIDNTQGERVGHNLSQVIFTPATTETYYVAVGAGSHNGKYRLQVREHEDDFTAGPGDAPGELVVEIPTDREEPGEGFTTGELEFPNDRDWFAVTLEAGLKYRISLEGSRSGAGTLQSPTLLGVYDTNVDLISGTKKSGIRNDPMTIVAPGEDGTYYVAVGASNYKTGTYTLSIAEEWKYSDKFSEDTDTRGMLVDDGNPRSGTIDYKSDIDWFAVELYGGITYQFIQTSKSGLGSKLSGIYDKDGNPIDEDGNVVDDQSADHVGIDNATGSLPLTESFVNFKPKADGTYYVAAGGDGATTGAYTLRMRVQSDDVGGGLGNPGRVTVGDSAETGYIHSLYDSDWYAVVLDQSKTYLIDLKGAETGAGTLPDPYLRLRRVTQVDGEAVAESIMEDDDSGAGLDSHLSFKPTVTGTYYLDVSSAVDWESGTYALSVTEEVI